MTVKLQLLSYPRHQGYTILIYISFYFIQASDRPPLNQIRPFTQNLYKRVHASQASDAGIITLVFFTITSQGTTDAIDNPIQNVREEAVRRFKYEFWNFGILGKMYEIFGVNSSSSRFHYFSKNYERAQILHCTSQ